MSDSVAAIIAAVPPFGRRPDPPPRRRRPTSVAPGDRVRIVAATSPQAGQSGTVVRVAGRSVVLELDRPFASAGSSQRLYYSYPGELELVPRVGRMGARDLFADDDSGSEYYSPAGNA
jgi:hypothetical protein